MSVEKAKAKAASLTCWSGPVDPRPLSGGITNLNFVIKDAGRKFVARIGDDIPIHQIMRFNEVAASRAAEAAGVSPAVHHTEPSALVIDFIVGETYGEADVRSQEKLDRIVPLLQKVHRDIPSHLRGPVLTFWVFHVIRDYAWTLKAGDSHHLPGMPALLDAAADMEAAIGPIDLVFGHNDLLPANFIDDGERIWLVDWDYAGFNSPLFDLGGLASNNGLDSAQEDWLLETYFDKTVTDELRYRYTAMKCASLLRETVWSMVQEIHSDLDFDYAGYTDKNRAMFDAALADFRAMG